MPPRHRPFGRDVMMSSVTLPPTATPPSTSARFSVLDLGQVEHPPCVDRDGPSLPLQRQVERLEYCPSQESWPSAPPERRACANPASSQNAFKMRGNPLSLVGVGDDVRHQISIENIGKSRIARRQGRNGLAELCDPRPRPASLRELVEAVAQRALGARHVLDRSWAPSDPPYSNVCDFRQTLSTTLPTRSSSIGPGAPYRRRRLRAVAPGTPRAVP